MRGQLRVAQNRLNTALPDSLAFSPNGHLVVGNELSGTTTIYQVIPQ